MLFIFIYLKFPFYNHSDIFIYVLFTLVALHYWIIWKKPRRICRQQSLCLQLSAFALFSHLLIWLERWAEEEKTKTLFLSYPCVRACQNPVFVFLFSVSNKWIHERGQEWRRPCGLNETEWWVRHNLSQLEPFFLVSHQRTNDTAAGHLFTTSTPFFFCQFCFFIFHSLLMSPKQINCLD